MTFDEDGEANAGYADYPLDVKDPFLVRQVESLKAAGIPRCVGVPAVLKADRERTAAVAYT